MGGTSHLAVTVEVAFGADPLDTGTLTWTDITDCVRRDGIDFSRGWDTEAGQLQAGRLTFTVNNESGNFTPGTTGALGEIRNRLPVRVKQSTTVLWTGLVESWRISWTNGVRSQVAVTCVDRWAAIRRIKFDGEFLRRGLVEQSPTYLWTFTKSTTSQNRAEATVGGDAALLDFSFMPPGLTVNAPTVQNPQSWQPYEPAATTTSTPYDIPFGDIYGGTSITATGATSVAWTASVWIYNLGSVAVLNNNGSDGVTFSGGTSNSYNIMLQRASGSSAQQAGGASSRPDGWSHYALSVSVNGSGAVTAKYYFNGALVLTNTVTWPTGGWTTVQDMIYLDAPNGFAYLGIWNTALSDAQILEQYRLGTSAGVAGETASVRAARLLSYIDSPPTLTTTGTFTATMSTQDLTDKSLGDALLECSTAERGTLYMDRDGWPVLTSRSWRVGAAVAFTIPATALGREVSWTLDDQNLANSATVERMVGDTSAATVKAKNDASVTTYGEQNRSLQIWVDTDAQLLERANAEANMDAYPLPRSSDLTVDLLTKAATIPAATLLAADIGQRIAVSGLPAEAPGETEFYIENIADKITTGGWERTFTVSPRADYFTVEDATYGALDSIFVLAF